MSEKMKTKENTEDVPEKRRVAKAAVFILFCVLLERYSTAGFSCKCILRTVNLR